MSKKNIAIILEIIPIISAVISFILFRLPYDSKLIRLIIAITFLLSFLGFVFFFIGRGLDKENKIVRILGVLDWFAVIYIIVIYIIAIFVFGL